MDLRDYQKEAIEKIVENFANNGKNLVVLWPQGTGKTLVGLEVIRRYKNRISPTKTLLTFRNVNVKDTWKRHIIEGDYKDLGFASLIGLGPFFRKRCWDNKGLNNVFITSEALARDIERGFVNLEDFGLIVVDEASKIAAEYFDGYRLSLPFRFFSHLNGHKVLLLIPASCEKDKLDKILEIMKAEVLDLSDESVEEIEGTTPTVETEIVRIKDELVSYIDRKIKKFCGWNYWQLTVKTGIDFSKKPRTFFWREKLPEFKKRLSENEIGKLIYNFKVIEELNSTRYFLFYNNLRSFEKRLDNALQRTKDNKYPKLLKELIGLTPQIKERKLEKMIEITSQLIGDGKRVIIYTPFKTIARKLKNKFDDLKISCDLYIGGMEFNTNTDSKVLIMTSVGAESLNLSQFDATVYLSFPRKNHTRKQISGRMRGGKEIFIVYEGTTEENAINEFRQDGDTNVQ